MPHELHLHPDRLAGHAVTAAELSEELLAALRGSPCADGFPAEVLSADEERVRAAVQRAVRELAALGAALAGAAAGYETVDRDLARSLGQVLGGERR